MINTIDQILNELIADEYDIRCLAIGSQKEQAINEKKQKIVEKFLEVLDALHEQRGHFSALEKMDNLNISFGDQSRRDCY